MRLKNDPNRKDVLVSFKEMREQISDEQLEDIDMEKALGHLHKHGDVMFLYLPSGEKLILLDPNRLFELTKNYIEKAEKEGGVLDEVDVLKNEHNFEALNNLREEESKKLLVIVNEIYKKRGICFSLLHDYQKYLIFPTFFRPFSQNFGERIDDSGFVGGNTYFLRGEVKNVYPALTALLGRATNLKCKYTSSTALQYMTQEGTVCSFRLAEGRYEELKLELFYEKKMEEFDRARFWGLVEQILSKLPAIYVKKFPPVFCPKCGKRQGLDTIIDRVIVERKNYLYCYACDEERTTIQLSELPEYLTKHSAFAMMRNAYNEAWESVKNRSDLIHNLNMHPTCFVSYAWENPEVRRWVSGLVEDLEMAEVKVAHDARNNSAGGSSIEEFIRKIDECQFVIVIGEPFYLQRSKKIGTPLAREVEKINYRLEIKGLIEMAILPIIWEGTKETAILEKIRDTVYLDFSFVGKYHEGKYFVVLFDLLLDLYHIKHTECDKTRKELLETMCNIYPDLKDISSSKYNS